MSEQKKIRTICIDTLTGIMDEMYMTSITTATHDKWKNWGQGIWQLISDLQSLKFELLIVIGKPGSGKSSGMRTLPSKTNIWFNADNKNPVWKGGKEEYGKKSNPKAPYHIIPKCYDDIISHILDGMKKNMFEKDKYAILTGHTEDYKTVNDINQRLKVIGNVTNKMNLEGRLETVLYSSIVKDNDLIKYVLETENSGKNTARSPMGLFKPIIKNDYNFVINKLLTY